MDYKIKGETLTEIADAIREKTGSTEPIKPEEMANGIEDVAAAISQAEYDKFWDEYQENGKRTNCRFLFGGRYWNDERVSQYKYPICPNDTKVSSYFMFSYSEITNLSTVLHRDNRLVLKTGEYVFSNCSKLERVCPVRVGGWMAATFSDCPKLSIIDELTVSSSDGTSVFSNVPHLTYIKWSGENCIGVPINLSSAKNETTITIPEDVYDNDGNLIYAAGEEITETGLLYYPTISTLIPALKTNANKTLTLAESDRHKVSDTDLATITQKGWTVAWK